MKLIISEQEKKRIRSLYYVNEQTPLIRPETDDERESKSKEYPNYCLYPKFAKDPSSTPAQGGSSGEDLLIDGHCLYAQPKDGSIKFETSGIWLPNTGDTRIGFWSQDKREKYYKTYKSYLNTVTVGKTKLSDDEIKEQVNKLYKDGLVYAFKINNVVYKPAITYAPDYFTIAFAGFYVEGRPQSDETRYKSPKWIDKRDDFQRFIDKYEDKIGYAAMAIGIALSAVFTGPFAIFLEIAFELGVGIPLAIRSFQKGENTEGLFNILGSLLPFLRLSKSFKGIKQETLDSLILKLQQREQRLVNATSTSKAKNFYNGLTTEEKELLTKLLDEDEYGLWEVLKNMENPKYFEDIVVRDLRAVLKENPTALGKKSFWKTIMGKELKVTGGFMLVSYIYESLFGWVLDAEDKEKLDGLEKIIPENFKPEFYETLFSSTEEQANNLMNNGGLDNVGQIAYENKDVNQGFRNLIKFLEESKKIREKIIPSSDTVDSKKMESEGWVDLFKWDNQGLIIEQKSIGGVVWLKVDKTKIGNQVEKPEQDSLNIGNQGEKPEQDSLNLKNEIFFRKSRKLMYL